MSDNKKPTPQRLPEPTYWPFFLAFGITFLLWGILSSFLISIIGLILSVIAVAGWMYDLYHEITISKKDEL